MKLQIVFVVFAFSCALANSQATVDPKIWENLEENATTNVLVSFKKADPKAALATLETLGLTTRDAILMTQYYILKKHAKTVQADVKSMLKKLRKKEKKTHKVNQLWITAELIVRNADRDVVEGLANHADVESLTAEWFIPLEDVFENEIAPQDENTITNQWGVVNVGAPTVWNTGNRGEGVVIGVIDTGARATHMSIRGSYRGYRESETHNYNFFSPNEKADIPSDTNGHGTHVIGIASGVDGIGVAPGIN